jgi:hypothetical protein
LDDPRAIPALSALCDDRLRAGTDGHAYIFDSKTRDVKHPVTGAVIASPPRPLKEVETSNDIRRVALPVLAQLQLASPDTAVRLSAAEELSKTARPTRGAAAPRAGAREGRRRARALALAVARADLASAIRDARSRR